MGDKVQYIQCSEKVIFFKLNGHDHVMTREYGILPNKLPANGIWIIRNKNTGELVDYDRYSNDLLSKYNLINSRYIKGVN
jgi:hypothetical protein